MEELKEKILVAMTILQQEARINGFSESIPMAGNIACNVLVTLSNNFVSSLTFYSDKKAKYQDVFWTRRARMEFIIDPLATVDTIHQLIGEALTSHDLGIENEKLAIAALKESIKRYKKKTKLVDVWHATDDEDHNHGIDAFVSGHTSDGLKNMPLSIKLSLDGAHHRNYSGKMTGDSLKIVHPTLVFDFRFSCTYKALHDIADRLFFDWFDGSPSCYCAILK